ncbi:MAG TPA: response regulator [Myxococcaceae bacterium]|nr:response regulator [Myxococcaceae bacterium]HET6983293.1 response regulator [Myxococcaceae bacterium]
MSPELEGPPVAAADSASEETGEAAGARRRVENVRRSVLIVEDDPAQRAMLLELISLWGYRTVAVGSAEEAGTLLESAGALDIAVVDVFLPGESGVQLITRLRERFPESVLIGISALSTAATARRCKGIGADLFIGKPLEPARLAEALQSRHQSWH